MHGRIALLSVKFFTTWCRSKFIEGHQGSKPEIIANMISPNRKLCFACGLLIMSTRTLLVLVDVKGHLRSSKSTLCKAL